MRISWASSLLLFYFGFSAADTLTITMFASEGCTSPTEIITLGNLNECHNVSTFASIQQSSVAQTFFGRGLRIRTYSQMSCQGTPYETELSNNFVCDGPIPGQVSFLVGEEIWGWCLFRSIWWGDSSSWGIYCAGDILWANPRIQVEKSYPVRGNFGCICANTNLDLTCSLRSLCTVDTLIYAPLSWI